MAHQPKHRLTTKSQRSGCHCKPTACTDHRVLLSWERAASVLASCRLQVFEGGAAKTRRQLLQQAVGCPGASSCCCKQPRPGAAPRKNKTERSGLSKEGGRGRQEPQRPRTQTWKTNRTSNSKTKSFNSLCEVGQRLPLHPNLLSVMSKSEMTWKGEKTKSVRDPAHSAFAVARQGCCCLQDANPALARLT